MFAIKAKDSLLYVLGLILQASQTCLPPAEIKSLRQTTLWRPSHGPATWLSTCQKENFSVPRDARRFWRSSCFWPGLPLGFGRFAKPRWVNEAVRGATFLCRFASADQKHPVGVLTNFPSLRGDLYLGWPRLFSTGDQLAYNGPLPRDCPCTRSHAPMKGTSGCIFNSATSRIFLLVFWAHILCAIGEVSDPVSLRDRGVELTSGPSSSSSPSLVSSSSFSLSSSTGALHPLFLAWFSRSLSRSLLRDYADSSAVDQFLSCAPDGPLSVLRPSFGTRCQAYSLSSSGCSQLQLMAPSSFGSGTPSLASTRARSRSCRSLKKPLVSLRPRDSVGDGDGPRLLVPGSGPSAVLRSSAP